MSIKTSIEKGDDFESRSRKIIERMIDESQIAHLRDYIKIFDRTEKGYYSKSREKNIYFDLTIEVWPPDAKIPTFTYFIECKNYGKSIPVNDVEEFYTKVRQVSGLNAKAIFIANAPLQEGGYNFAKNEGMMFVQGESSDDYKIILYKSSNNTNDSNIPLLKSTLADEAIGVNSLPLVELIDSVIISAFKKIESANFVSYNIDKLSRDNIIQMAEKELSKIDSKILGEGRSLSVKKLTNYLKLECKISVEPIETSAGFLGSYNRDRQLISISSTIIGTEWELFIIAHEFGHYTLHSKLQIGQITYDTFEDSEINFRTGRRDLKNPKNWIEWQANQFASSLVLPRACVLVRLRHCQDNIGIRRGKLYVDDQEINQKTFYEIVKRLAYIFNVSKTSIIYKLKEMDLLEENSRLKSIGQIIAEYNSDLMI